MPDTTSKAPSEGWIHIGYSGQDRVVGPFSGNGIFDLLAVGLRLYASQAEAAKGPVQQINQEQATAIEKQALSGPGIGHGFGLGGDLGSVAAPFSALGEIGHWIGLLVSHLADVHMWISLGWLALGLLLLLVGLAMWLGIGLPGPAGKLAKAA